MHSLLKPLSGKLSIASLGFAAFVDKFTSLERSVIPITIFRGIPSVGPTTGLCMNNSCLVRRSSNLFLNSPGACFSVFRSLCSVAPGSQDPECSIMAAINNLEATFCNFETTINRRMEGIENQMGGLESRVGSLESLVGSVESRMGSLETQMGSLETQMGNLEKTLTNVNKSINTRLGKLESLLGLEQKQELAAAVEKFYGPEYAQSLSAQSIVDLVSMIPQSQLPVGKREQLYTQFVTAGMGVSQRLVNRNIPVEFLRRLHLVTRIRAKHKEAKAKRKAGAGNLKTEPYSDLATDGDGNSVAANSGVRGKSNPNNKKKAPGVGAGYESYGFTLADESTVLNLDSWNHLSSNATDRHLLERVTDYLQASDSDKANALVRCQSIGISVMLFAIEPKFIFPENEKENLTFYTELEFDNQGRMTLYRKEQGWEDRLEGCIEIGQCNSSGEFGKAFKQMAVQLYALHWILGEVMDMQGVKMGRVSKIGRLFVPRCSEQKRRSNKVIKDVEVGGVRQTLENIHLSLHVEYL